MQRGRREGQITATSIGKCWHLRRQMTSRGRKALSVTCGDSSPKGEPRHHILAQEMERICIDTLHSLFYGYPSMRVPPESRMVVKRFPSGTPCLSLWERWPAQRGRRGQITATSIGKCWHLRRQMTSRGRKALSVTCGDGSPKRESQGIVYWHKKWSVSVSIRSIHCFTATPQCACRPKVGWS